MGGKLPRHMIANRDFKLIGGNIAKFLSSVLRDDNEGDTNQAFVSGAPTGRQNQNGLSEINWHHVMNMVRNWLTSNYLPKKCWYFGLKAAAQVSNYMPILHKDGVWTTPFEEMHGVKLDWQNLVPMFSLSYVKRRRDAGVKRSTAESHSIKAICVGNDTQSNGLLFYLPNSKKLIASSDYCLD
eukprot:15337988-Ditylum_brightwellii.AAC.1